jgi:dihydropteroate synthase
MEWRCRDRVFEVSERVLVMGVLNVTPDSFSDGGRFIDPGAAIAHARSMLEQGADLIDVGAESTRPGSVPVPADEQWRRLEPVLEVLGREPAACVSVDTASAEVARRALDLGAQVVNDVTALDDPDMAGVVARAGAGVVLMHMRGTPADMQREPRYEDVAREVTAWLAVRLARARDAGIAERSIALDPGIGFGKTLEHNLELLARLDEIAELDRPLVIGVSRKSFLGRLTDRPLDQRLEAGLAASAIAVFQGAAVLRTHDVESTRQATLIAAALRGARRAPRRSGSAKIG